jgi:D-alanine transaminase
LNQAEIGECTTTKDLSLKGVLMKNLAYYNGKIDLIDNLMIPLNDRSHFFGDGVYDATISRNYQIYLLDEHIERFFNSMRLIDINPSFTKIELKQLLKSLIKKLDTGYNFVYFQATRGTAIRNHDYNPEMVANLTIFFSPFEPETTAHPKAIGVALEEDVRFELCNIKTLNLLPNILAKQRASQNGLSEVIFHRKGRVTECSHSNVHILKDGIFQTAPADHWILAGITRQQLLNACRELAIPTLEKAFSVDEMMVADEIIISNAGGFCVPVYQIDSKKVGGKDNQNLNRLQIEVYNHFLKATE